MFVEKNVPGITPEEFNRMLMKEKEKKEEMVQSNSLEKIDLNLIEKKNFSRFPFSAPVKSNRDDNFKNIGILFYKKIFFFFLVFNIFTTFSFILYNYNLCNYDYD